MIRTRRGRCLSLLVTLAALLWAVSPAQACQPVFSTCTSSAFVNQPAPTTVDSHSAQYVTDVLSWTGPKNTWINTNSFGVAVYYVPSWQPTVSVRVTGGANNPGTPKLQTSWQSVPIPPSAKPAAGTDGHMVVIQPDTNRMWEFWGGTGPEADGTLNWHAGWGGTLGPGFTSGTYTSTAGYYNGSWSTGWEQRWGATASSISVLAGLITASDLFSGSIDHALALGIPCAQRANFAYPPASRTDGNGCSGQAVADSIPMGQEFYIPASVDLSQVPCHYALSCMIDRALQRYGMFVRDTTGNSMVLYGEATASEGKPDVWGGTNGFMAGQYPNNLLADVDWADLVAAPSSIQGGWTR